MRLVEMDMTVDERRQQERAGKIDALATRRGASGRMQRRNEAAGDLHVGEAPFGKTRVGQEHQARFRRFAAAYW